jgi:hypothetical protein
LRLLRDGPLKLALPARLGQCAEIDHRRVQPELGGDALNRSSIGLPEGRSQNLVPTYHFVQSPGHEPRVYVRDQSTRNGFGVGHVPRRQPIQEPEPLLAEAERGLFRLESPFPKEALKTGSLVLRR